MCASMPKRRTFKLTNALQRVAADVTNILSKHQSSRYCEGSVLMYSMSENVLKWTVFVKLLWEKCDHIRSKSETQRLTRFCNQQDFYSALNLALASDLIKYG